MKFLAAMCVVFLLASVLLFSAGEEKSCDYDSVRIKKMPAAMQCWTFHKFSFFETLEKVKALGIKYLEAYPGQVLDKKDKIARFGHFMTEEQVKLVKSKLKEYGITLTGYGVVGFKNEEASMKEVFDFAKKMGALCRPALPVERTISRGMFYRIMYAIPVRLRNMPGRKYCISHRITRTTFRHQVFPWPSIWF